MNWKQISEQYPKAWDRLADWCQARYSDTEFHVELQLFAKWLVVHYPNGGGEDIFNVRDLYTFFDQEGIHCTICIIEKADKPMTFIFGWEIEGIYYGYHERPFPTRIESECDLFTKAFSILEERSIV